MDNQEVKPTQSILIKDRKVVEIDGVKKLDSFDSKEFLLDTVNGFVHVKGNELSLGTMDTEKGTLTIYGTIDSISYLAKNRQDKKESFFAKVFK